MHTQTQKPGITSPGNLARLLVSFVLLLPAFLQLSAQEDSPRRMSLLREGWKFIKEDVAQDVSFENWEEVEVPHTWNARDGMARGYYRGPGWYARDLQIPTLRDGRRVFLRFNGASVVSDVYLNGRHLGQHRGAFGAFCFELTPWLKADGKNELRVRVDNTRFNDIAPWSGDFVIFGGIYRDVELIESSATCISPLDHGSPGVYLRQKEATEERAVMSIDTLVSSTEKSAKGTEVRITILDADGRPLLTQQEKVNVKAGDTTRQTQTVTLKNPHLWDGVRDPYLHTARIEVLRNGKVLDRVEQPVGFRTITHDFEKGILLNGRPYPVRGVSRHQDREWKGWALSEADKEEDMRIIKEMGATAIRLAHYPHDTYFHNLCDREGMLVWAELALVNHVIDSEAFTENVLMQFRELIRQHGNHPSIAMWSLYNEIIPASGDAGLPLVKALQKIADEEDPTRFTIAAPYRLTPEPLRQITTLLAFNGYPGWYDYVPERTMTEWLDDWLKHGGSRGICVSEYGAGASILHHDELPCPRPYHLSPWHPEEYQAQVIEDCLRQMEETPGVWGSFVWNMFDFACPSRHEGDRTGNLDKGIVTFDRRVAKDAYYFYKANWNSEPMIYITSRRFTERRVAETTVKIYSNCDSVELFVNGRSQGKRSPDKYKRILWEKVPLDMGENKILAKASSGEIEDSCTWFRLPPRPPSGMTASASESLPSNPPANAIDFKFHTGWVASCENTRPELTVTLDSPRELDSVSILWWYGYNRTVNFVLEGSADGVNYKELVSGTENRPGGPRLYGFPKQTLSHLRVKATAKHRDSKIGITELQLGRGEWPAVAPLPYQTSRLIKNLNAGKSQTLVLYGTSLTMSQKSWAKFLSDLLKERYGDRITTINSARGGMNSTWGLQNIDERVIAHKPDTVIIEFAMNDSMRSSKLSVTDSQAQLEEMVRRIRAANPQTEIILMTMNPVGAQIEARPENHPHSRSKLNEYYQSVRVLATTLGLQLIDHHQNWNRYRQKDPEGFARHVYDGVHPDTEISQTLILPAMLEGLGMNREDRYADPNDNGTIFHVDDGTPGTGAGAKQTKPQKR